MKFLNSEGVEKLCEKIGSLLAGKLNIAQGTENVGKVQIINSKGEVQPSELSGNFSGDLVADSGGSNPISVRELSQKATEFENEIEETNGQLETQELRVSASEEATQSLAEAIESESRATDIKFGDLTELTTDTKSDIVSAINENVDAVKELAETADQLDSRIGNNSTQISELETATDYLSQGLESLDSKSDTLLNRTNENTKAIQENTQAIEDINKYLPDAEGYIPIVNEIKESKAGIVTDEENGTVLTGIVFDKTVTNPVNTLYEAGETSQKTFPGNNIIDINNRLTIHNTLYYGSEVNIAAGTKLYVRRKGGSSISIRGLNEHDEIVTAITSYYVTESKVIITANENLTAIFITSDTRNAFVQRNGKLMISKNDFTEIESYVGGETSPNIYYPQAVTSLLGYDTIQETSEGYTYSRSSSFKPEDPLQFYAVKIEDSSGNTRWVGTKAKIPVLYEGDKIDFATGEVKRKNLRIDYPANQMPWELRNDGYIGCRLTELKGGGFSSNVYSNISIPDNISIMPESGYIWIKSDKLLNAWTSALGNKNVYFVIPLTKESESTIEIVGKFPTGDSGALTITGNGILNLEYIIDLKTFIINTVQSVLT